MLFYFNSNLSEKVDSLSGECSDSESTTYTALSVDGVGYDEENNQLLLKVNGADSVLPFSSGFKETAYANGQGTYHVIVDKNGNKSSSTTGKYFTIESIYAANTVKIKALKSGKVMWAYRSDSSADVGIRKVNAGDIISAYGGAYASGGYVFLVAVMI